MSALKNLSAALACSLLATLAHADRSQPGESPLTATPLEWQFKLTPTYLATAGSNPAGDLNLRANTGPHALWLATYRQPGSFQQTRTGYEYTARWDYLKLVPSLQAATHGFVGGSLNAEIGGPLFALLGFGRTNTRPYYNLNIDPNDMQTYGLGSHLSEQTSVALYTVRDDRLYTGQRISHLLFRQQLDAHNRLTVDLFQKRGRADENAESVRGNGLAVTWDRDQWFVRLAHEQKVGFGNSQQNRFSLGWRF